MKEIKKAERIKKRILQKQGGRQMSNSEREKYVNCKSLDDILDVEYGPRGTEERERFETAAEAFCLAETLKQHRKEAGLTQEQLAERIGTKKSYISKIENGHTDIQLSTLFRIFAGLGKHISLTVF